MAPARLSLTTEERILLYLSDFKGMGDRFELPASLTQKEIAFAAGIHRKHVSRYLDRLTKEGAVEGRKAHVEGMKQRMLAYYLAPGGWERAKRIIEHLETVQIPVKVQGRTKDMTLHQIDAATSIHLTFSDIVREAMDHPVLDMKKLETIDERRRAEIDERIAKIEAYTKAMLTAWHDGRVTATEQLLLDQLREHLRITELEHKRIESDTLEKVLWSREEESATYRDLLRHAYEDGKGTVATRAREVLEDVRELLGIPKRQAGRIEREIVAERGA